jgi:ABC-type polysaccharide/polyol phosphate transport system ATPase subunit
MTPNKLIRETLSESPCAMDNVMDYAQITNFINSPFGTYADNVFSRNAFDITYNSNPTLPAATPQAPSTDIQDWQMSPN